MAIAKRRRTALAVGDPFVSDDFNRGTWDWVQHRSGT
jgi:hypothetical protein